MRACLSTRASSTGSGSRATAAELSRPLGRPRPARSSNRSSSRRPRGQPPGAHFPLSRHLWLANFKVAEPMGASGRAPGLSIQNRARPLKKETVAGESWWDRALLSAQPRVSVVASLPQKLPGLLLPASPAPGSYRFRTLDPGHTAGSDAPRSRVWTPRHCWLWPELWQESGGRFCLSPIPCTSADRLLKRGLRLKDVVNPDLCDGPGAPPPWHLQDACAVPLSWAHLLFCTPA